MGPGPNMCREISVNDRAYFSPGINLFEWQKTVVEWVRRIEAAHEYENNCTYHTLFKTLGQTLYMGRIPREQLAIVDEA